MNIEAYVVGCLLSIQYPKTYLSILINGEERHYFVYIKLFIMQSGKVEFKPQWTENLIVLLINQQHSSPIISSVSFFGTQ